MFKCDVTGKTSKRGEKLNKIVIQTRPRVYTEKVWEDGELVEIEIGKGWEIVKEINATDEGLKLYNQMVEDGTAEQFVRRFH
jgi:hypothetical protein